jgi:hypothetical protein
MKDFDYRKYLAEGKLFEEEEKLQMTYKGDPVNLQISKFGGTSEEPNETVLFIAVGGKGKRRSKGSKSTLERRLKLLDKKVDKILFTDNDNITKEIKSFNKSDFKIKDKDLAEGKLLNEVELTDDLVQRVAQAIADEFTAEDRELDLKYVITPNSIEADPRGGGFDLDVNAGPNTPGEDWKDSRGFGIANYLGDYAGGSFVIRPEGNGHLVTNAASRNAKVAYITPEGEIEIISAEDSKADLGMTDNVETDYMERRKEMSDYMKENKINESIAGYINLNPINMDNKTIKEKKQGYNDELDDSLGMKHGSKKQDFAQRRADSENMEKAEGNRKYSGDKSKDKGRKKIKKETMDSKLSEIEKAGKITTLEAQIEAISEMIESKNQRISMVTEDDNLSELVDKNKMKEMQREVKLLEKKKAGMEKMYEKMCGKKYVQEFFSSSTSFEKIDKNEEEFEQMNENKNKNIMKKSDLREMIKSAFLEEADLNIKDETNMYDPVAEQEDVEVEDDENVDVNIEKDVEVDVDDESTETDTVVKTSLPGESKDVEKTLGLLTKAQQTAQALGDEKLTDQIGNTITYFTRAHVARQNESLNESIKETAFPMWNKIK